MPGLLGVARHKMSGMPAGPQSGAGRRLEQQPLRRNNPEHPLTFNPAPPSEASSTCRAGRPKVAAWCNVGVDFQFFRNQFWERLIVNIALSGCLPLST